MLSFFVWLLLGASVAYWGLQLFNRPLALPALTLQAGDARGGAADLSRLLGSTATPVAEPEPVAQTRLRLLGVVAPRSARAAEAGEGVALIEVDGVARTVRVGAPVDGELALLRVDARSASLGRIGQAPSQVLSISPAAAPATGTLAPAAPSPVVLGGNPQGLPLAAGQSGLPPQAQPAPPQNQQGQPGGQMPQRPPLTSDELPGTPPTQTLNGPATLR